MTTVALRRTSPEARLDPGRPAAGRVPAAAQHRRLLHRPRRRAHGQLAGGVRHRLGQARGHRRRPDPAPRRGRAPRRRRDPGRRRLHRARLHQRRPGPGPPPGRARLRRSHALGSPIGSGMGITNPTTCASSSSRPPSRWCWTPGSAPPRTPPWPWKLGCDAVLLASAVTRAQELALMAEAMRKAVEAGRLAHRAGRIPRRLYARSLHPHRGRPRPLGPPRRGTRDPGQPTTAGDG